jgi:hypothetical protein
MVPGLKEAESIMAVVVRTRNVQLIVRWLLKLKGAARFAQIILPRAVLMLISVKSTKNGQLSRNKNLDPR